MWRNLDRDTSQAYFSTLATIHHSEAKLSNFKWQQIRLSCEIDIFKYKLGQYSTIKKDASFLQSHDNPPAALATSLPTFEDFQLSKVYVGLKIFWANKCPQANDFIIIEFLTPVILYKYV